MTEQQPQTIDWAVELTFQLEEGGETYPFVEDENANITGFGHQDKAAFADALSRYEEQCLGMALDEDDHWRVDQIDHRWGQPYWVRGVDDEWRLRPCTSDAKGAIPVTTVWDAR